MGDGRGTLFAALMSALLSSSSRANSRSPFRTDMIKAVTPRCVGEAGKESRGNLGGFRVTGRERFEVEGCG
jgi:hypothetical protein